MFVVVIIKIPKNKIIYSNKYDNHFFVLILCMVVVIIICKLIDD